MISQQYEIGPDISEQLFDNILTGEIFQAWKTKENTWPLYIVGGPGSGKSTLASIVSQHLRKDNVSPAHAVVSIFVQQQLLWDDGARISLLFNILEQLNGGESHVQATTGENPTHQIENRIRKAKPKKKTKTKPEDDPDVEISLIHAIKEELRKFEGAFLIFDAIDRYGCFPGGCADDTWEQFQELGFKVMLTTRTLAYDDEEIWETCCDACPEGPLQIYWRCDSGKHKTSDEHVDADDGGECEEGLDCGNSQNGEDVDQGTYILCQECYKSNEVCPAPECQAKDSFVQPYTRRRIEMNEAVAGTISNFIACELETEHGDLGLDSDAADTPPLSQFGAALLNSRRPLPAEWLRDHISSLADHNVALARLRVDIVHENMATIQDAEAMPGGLPSALTVLFDAEIRGVLGQSREDADLGIRALALWAEGAETEMELLGELEATGLVEEGACTAERVLHATRGLLMVAKLESRPIVAYSYTFRTYVTGGYCAVVDSMRAELAGRANLSGQLTANDGV
ncbi:hypothetical protein BJ166DRAFT_525192 [Pestalotiopsis sp. NC0098]|nr:hypothetical protein BJ166DRAFT_525192 [Pestalotiopsis sp. NC0098]